MKVCRPISWPPATTCRISSGLRVVIAPVTKKSARMSWAFSTSSTFGVHSGDGPSSKLSTTVLSGMR